MNTETPTNLEAAVEALVALEHESDRLMDEQAALSSRQREIGERQFALYDELSTARVNVLDAAKREA